MDGLEIESVEVDASGKDSVAIPVPEGFASPAAPVAPVAAFTGEPGNLMADLAALAAEKTAAVVAPPPPFIEPTPVPKPETTIPAMAPATEVPAKFKNEDGTVSLEKIEKSTVNAEEAYKKYAEIERNLRQKQNEVAALNKTAPAPQSQVPPIAPNTPLSPLERDMAQAIFNDAQALGQPISEIAAIVQARSQIRIADIQYQASLGVTEQLRDRFEAQDRRTELEKIAEHDAWVISPEGVEALGKIRASYPHVNQSETPWTAAYDQHLANQVKQQRLAGQVTTPTPTAKTARPPATPVQAAPRVVVKPSEPNMSGWNSSQISAYVASLPAAEQDAFYAKRGIRLGAV